MEPKGPRTLTDDELERRLREEAHERYNAELWVRREPNGEWAIGFKLHMTPPEQADPDPTSALHQEILSPDRRTALEQLWLVLDIEDDLADYRRER